MEVILLERVAKLGQMGEVVRVKDGFARNFLLPHKKALRATKNNIDLFEKQRAALESRNAAERGKAEALAARLSAIDITIARRVGDTEQLYGSVTAADITDFLKAKGFDVDRRKLILPEAIKAIGAHDVPLKLHREVTVPLKVKVVKEGAAQTSAS